MYEKMFGGEDKNHETQKGIDPKTDFYTDNSCFDELPAALHDFS